MELECSDADPDVSVAVGLNSEHSSEVSDTWLGPSVGPPVPEEDFAIPSSAGVAGFKAPAPGNVRSASSFEEVVTLVSKRQGFLLEKCTSLGDPV